MTTRRRAIVVAIVFYVLLWGFIVYANYDELMADFVWR